MDQLSGLSKIDKQHIENKMAKLRKSFIEELKNKKPEQFNNV